jgi:hypothetical protein
MDIKVFFLIFNGLELLGSRESLEARRTWIAL